MVERIDGPREAVPDFEPEAPGTIRLLWIVAAVLVLLTVIAGVLAYRQQQDPMAGRPAAAGHPSSTVSPAATTVFTA